jgi:phosphopantothenoylcysteine decarboxylase/phosphopantothenate--cysteine ligase
LKPNPDILAGFSLNKGGRILVGFAAETEDLLVQAAEKLRKKKLDLLVANPVGGAEGTFGSDSSQATLLRPGQAPEALPRMGKRALAEAILDRVEEIVTQR